MCVFDCTVSACLIVNLNTWIIKFPLLVVVLAAEFPLFWYDRMKNVKTSCSPSKLHILLLCRLNRCVCVCVCARTHACMCVCVCLFIIMLVDHDPSNFCHFDDIVFNTYYIHSESFFFFLNISPLSVLFFASFLNFFFCCLSIFLHPKKTIFLSNFPCVSSHW